jgi:uncharacterized protein (TIGR03067 family)
MAVVLLVYGASRGADDAKEELKKLQGEWPVIAEEILGHNILDPSGNPRLIFDGETLTFKMRGRGASYSVKLTPSASPKAIDFTALEGTLKGQVLPSVYRLDDNELWICFGKVNKPRPDGFTTQGTGFTLYKCKRPKPPDEATVKEMKKLAGTWQVVAMEVAGEARHELTFKTMKYVISQGVITGTVGGKEGSQYYRYELDITTEPKAIDMLTIRRHDTPEAKRKGLDGEYPAAKLKGIYKLDGDELTLCLDVETAGRPAAFETKPKTMRTLYKLKREKP